ncbi:solute carrier family 23 protein [Shigella flexneri]
MCHINHAGSDLIFELENSPPFHQALVGAITHLLAILVPMVTPALIVGQALQLSAETTAYLVSMAIIASGHKFLAMSTATASSVLAYSKFSKSIFHLLRS